jgi:hypothetical protein
LSEKRRDKGHVVRAMFQKLEADIFAMVDGDDAYPAEKAQSPVGPSLWNEADTTVASRLLAKQQPCTRHRLIREQVPEMRLLSR